MTEEINIKEANSLINQLRKLQHSNFKRLVVSQLELWHSMGLTTYKIKIYRNTRGTILMSCPDPSRRYWGYQEPARSTSDKRWKEKEGHNGLQRRGSEGVWQTIRDIIHYGRLPWSTIVDWVKEIRVSGHRDLVKGKITLRDGYG
jgi:hypothetical protein